MKYQKSSKLFHKPLIHKLITMQRRPFREHHLLNIAQGSEQQNLPLDLFISRYFRANKALGPKDRGNIAESLYAIIRWQALVDSLCVPPITWEKRLEVFKTFEAEKYENCEEIPLHIRLSFPKVLFDLLVKSHGIEAACRLCKTSNSPAPTTIRVNSLKISRDDLMAKWKDMYAISPCKISPVGIVFHRKINFFGLPEFKEGLFEVQDEGSQLLAHMVQAKSGDLIMDYCAGSGGKTLAFAPVMQNTGQIYLHDIRPYILEECRKRLRRAGIQNAQIANENDPKLKKLKKKMDWVLVDAPCTGTGTMRRNPDMKWKFETEVLTRLIGQQRMIFEKALSFMKPEGRIIYGTCSVLTEENQAQVEHFVKTYNLEIEGEPFQSLPADGEMDGFFGVVLKFRG